MATPGGRAPTVDKVSLGDGAGDADTLARVRAKLDELQPVLSQPLALEEVDDSAYDLVFYPGGHGPMEDLAVDEASGRILAGLAGVVAVCRSTGRRPRRPPGPSAGS